tara:strand:+ start:830 stop:1459 length:630 start_codon:yes stop_codon:yes gene_type:complete
LFSQDQLNIDLVIVAGGKGQRFGSPKTLLMVKGKSLIEHSIDFFGCEWKTVTVVSHPSTIQELTQTINKKIQIVSGGKTRSESVRKGVLQGLGNFVIVHDVARPFPPKDSIRKLLEAVSEGYDAGSFARPISSSVCYIEKEIKNISRENLFEIQTPQIFRRSLLLELMGDDVTEETSLFFQSGYKVKMIQTNEPNPKITWKEDLDLVNG